MNSSLTYIESYFTGQLSDAEREQFEQQCIHDENFAADVAFYITAREGIRIKLVEEKNALWTAGETQQESVPASLSSVQVPETENRLRQAIEIKSGDVPGARMITLRRWFNYAAAACVILLATFYFINRTNSPSRLAHTYMDENYLTLGTQMNGTTDSIQSGIDAYNAKDYGKALESFKSIGLSHPDNSDAKKYAGLSYLRLKDFKGAINEFDQLASVKDLEVNLGLFLKAVSLMEREKPGDKENAKIILNEVVRKNLAGSKQAKDWLEKWKS